jgi:hypothetical protein
VDQKDYRRIYTEIVDGFSTSFLEQKRIFIKHQSTSDVVDYEIIYDKYYKYAKNRGLLNEEELLERLEQDGVWTKKDEADIDNQKFFLDNLIKSKSSLYLQSAIERAEEQQKEAEEKLASMKQKKEALLSNSVENYAQNRANDYFVSRSFFKDVKGKEHLFTEEEFEFLELSEIKKVIECYNNFSDRFSESSIQKLVLQDFYKIYYSFSEQSMDFFGKPVVALTNFQLNLILYTRIFKNIFEQNDDIPEQIMKDPKQLLDFASSSEARQKAKEKIQKAGDGGAGVMGATKQDLNKLGVDTPDAGARSLHEEAKKKGGSLSMKDLMDLGGF